MLVWWFKERYSPLIKGYAGLVVYADDFVVCFQHKNEAEEFLKHLRNRMVHYGPRLQEEKTRLIEFGRFAEGNARRRGMKPATFTFLGFTHYLSKSKTGNFRVKRKTAKKKFAKKCREMNKAIRARRRLRVGQIIFWINQVLVGYYHYYGITDNYKALARFKDCVTKMLYKWLNRRSQKKSITWDGLNDLLKTHPLANPKIFVDVYNYKFAD